MPYAFNASHHKLKSIVNETKTEEYESGKRAEKKRPKQIKVTKTHNVRKQCVIHIFIRHMYSSHYHPSGGNVASETNVQWIWKFMELAINYHHIYDHGRMKMI